VSTFSSESQIARWKLIGVVAVFLCLGWWLNVAVIQPHFILKSRLRQALSVAFACRVYADDHGGSYPGELPDLFPNYVSDERVLTFRSGDGQRILKCDYRGGGKRLTPDALLLRIEAEKSGGSEVIVQASLNGLIQKAPEE